MGASVVSTGAVVAPSKVQAVVLPEAVPLIMGLPLDDCDEVPAEALVVVATDEVFSVLPPHAASRGTQARTATAPTRPRRALADLSNLVLISAPPAGHGNTREVGASRHIPQHRHDLRRFTSFPRRS
jgi:hypothetical protein